MTNVSSNTPDDASVAVMGSASARIRENAELADSVLREALAGRSLVLIDRFGSAGRNTTTGPAPISALRPLLSIAYYDTWGNASPATLLCSEREMHVRSHEAKHHFVTQLREPILTFLRAMPAPPSVITWYETDELTSLFRPFGGELLTTTKGIRQRLEDKSVFDDLLLKAGVPESVRVESIRVPNSSALPDFAHLRSRFGTPFVVQASSSGGRGTIFVFSKADLSQARSLTGALRISRYIPGFSSNTTLLTIPDRRLGCAVYVDTPSHKAVDLPEVGIGPAKGAGNDWSLSFPLHGVETFVEAAVRIGYYAYRQYGLIGLWGLDSIWNGQTVFINELNCRNQGTTEVSGVNQLLRGFAPFISAHVTVHRRAQVSWLPSADDYNSETLQRASTARNPAPFYLKVRNRSIVPVRIRPGFSGSGIYQLTSDDRLTWCKPGAHTIAANFDEGRILVANAPEIDSICSPGAELCTLEGITTCHPIFSGPHALSCDGRRLVHAIYQEFIAA